MLLPPTPHLRSSALGRSLLAHAQRQPCHWLVNGRPVEASDVVARAGWLPALMAGAAWELQLPWEELAAEQFTAIIEPHSWPIMCGFYLASDPCPAKWTFPVWRHVQAHLNKGAVELDCSVNAWLEGIKGSPSPLRLQWVDPPVLSAAQ